VREEKEQSGQAERLVVERQHCYAFASPRRCAAQESGCCLCLSGQGCWNLVHVAHLVNSKACTIIVPYCQEKERLPCLNMGVSYHSKIEACERK
jgi:hypothetical protein